MLTTKISKKLQSDALSVCGSIFRMNAPHAIGYVFNSQDKKEVWEGMFVTQQHEIDAAKWTYYFEFKTGKFFKIGE